MRALARLLALATLLATPSARAGNAQSAKQLYEQAQAHFDVGRYQDAANEFEKVYELHPDPVLLYDIAQAQRLAGNHERALTFYKTFLRRMPDSPMAGEATSMVHELQVLLEKQKNAAKPSDKYPVGKPEPPLDNRATAVAPAPSPTPPRQDTPVYKKWWLWTAIGLVVASGAGGLIYYAVTSSNGPPKAYLCDGPNEPACAALLQF